MKKTLIFASFAPSLLLFRAHLIQAFLDQGHQVSVLAASSTLTQKFKSAFKERFPSVKILEIDLSLHGINPLKDLKVIYCLWRLFKKEQPDLVFSYTIKPVLYGTIAAHLAKVPRIISMITGLGTTFEMNTFKDKCLHRLVKVLYRFSLTNCHTVIFQNPDDASLFKDLKLATPQQILCVNGSGIDLVDFPLSPLPETISFIFVGRLIFAKGIFEFINAAQKIHEKYPHIIFRIVGDIIPGHPKSLSEQDLRHLKLLSYLDFTGQVDSARPYLAKSSIMVLPASHREGTPRSILEAMAMGRPIITTDVPGCRETVIEGLNGFLIPIKYESALVEKMELFIHNPELIQAMGLESRKLAEKKYDVHQVNKVIFSTILQ